MLKIENVCLDILKIIITELSTYYKKKILFWIALCFSGAKGC